MDPQNVNILTPRTYEHVTFHSERDFEDTMKVMDFKRERLSWIIWVCSI